MVTLEYTGWTTDGKAFDSTSARGRPSIVGVDRVMKGMTEGIRLMAVGEKRRLWIPENLAFAGQAGRPTGMVVFDIELVGFEPSPTQAPPDVARPPSDAKRTSSGLFYRVIRPGTGKQRPNERSQVTVHYTGWTTDGKMFDSSVVRGKPATFGLDQVIKGWTEGVQLMVTGEKTRFWIPEKLAYEGQSGSPRGMLVFDVELISIGK
jgi:peptidylprolyl isomerase